MNYYWREQQEEESDSIRLGTLKRIKSARTEHNCIECGKTIFVGESYWKQIYLYDGKIATENRHTRNCEFDDVSNGT